MKIDVPKMAVGIAGAGIRAANAAAHGDPVLADKSTKQKRLSICRNCDYFDDGQCQECLCLVRGKVILATESCPRNYW